MKEVYARAVELGVLSSNYTKHCAEDCDCAKLLKKFIRLLMNREREKALSIPQCSKEEFDAEIDSLMSMHLEVCDGCEHCVCARAHASASD
jgi:hypothetical protein